MMDKRALNSGLKKCTLRQPRFPRIRSRSPRVTSLRTSFQARRVANRIPADPDITWRIRTQMNLRAAIKTTSQSAGLSALNLVWNAGIVGRDDMCCQ